MTIMLETAQKVVSPDLEVCARVAIRRMTVIGIGLTLSGAGSDCFHAFSVRWRRKSILCAELRRGSGPHLKERLGNVPYVIAVGCKFADMNSVDAR